jgi:hypothetical protein
MRRLAAMPAFLLPVFWLSVMPIAEPWAPMTVSIQVQRPYDYADTPLGTLFKDVER